MIICSVSPKKLNTSPEWEQITICPIKLCVQEALPVSSASTPSNRDKLVCMPCFCRTKIIMSDGHAVCYGQSTGSWWRECLGGSSPLGLHSENYRWHSHSLVDYGATILLLQSSLESQDRLYPNRSVYPARGSAISGPADHPTCRQVPGACW